MATLQSKGYGKERVRLMRVKRDGSWYSVCELTVGVELQLITSKDYKYGDNSDVVATDSMKNTVYAMAKKNEVRNHLLLLFTNNIVLNFWMFLLQINSPEDFCVLLCKHFLNKYNQVYNYCDSHQLSCQFYLPVLSMLGYTLVNRCPAVVFMLNKHPGRGCSKEEPYTHMHLYRNHLSSDSAKSHCSEEVDNECK